jgi:pimeloyl-ACP methyl ester carboxylesterase
MNIRPIVRGAWALAFAALWGAALASPSRGQAEKKEIPEPEDLTLETKDGVSLRCTFYPGTAKKASAPIILVHGWEGQRGEFDGLALYLQSLGHTVIAPDLRGHGQSTVVKTPDGDSETIDLTKFRQRDLESMVLDLERCKRFLLDKNNEGECNIEMLCVIGSELGSIVALHWAARDWNAPVLPAYKQGQDVKALVLLTPQQSFKGLTTREPMSHPIIRSKLSMMLVAGLEDSKGRAEAKRLHKSLESSRPKIDDSDDEERRKKLDLFLVEPETSLTGTQLLSNSVKVGRGTVGSYIANFIALRLVAKQEEFAWTERKNPLRSE